ncbi:MAG TPA: M48 family metallopeptidase [Gemmatimonadaceae bacterium]|jgi:Zn-dependent protease with chaperone function|nr:M48 family metallopeptidase [Gemmatimonadaceae bacterium]
MANRVPLVQISSRAWEHPADRAALNTLRAIPGFDDLTRRVASFFGERGVRQLFLGDSVKVTSGQRPKLNAMWTEVLETLDWPDRPELYVTQTPIANAMAVGFEKPFVIMHSGLLEVLSEDEQRSVLGHELGHIMSGHTTYSTIAIILMYFGISNLPFIAAAAILPFQLALLEWYRKSEFSSDRAGLLATQDLNVVMSTEMKLAGGKEYGDDLRVEEFIRQAEQYETGGGAWDTVFKILNTVMRTHPMHTVRAAELLRWHKSGGYDTIVAGTYLRRGQSDSAQPLTEDYVDAAGYYGQKTRETFDTFRDGLNRAKDAVNSAWRNR